MPSNEPPRRTGRFAVKLRLMMGARHTTIQHHGSQLTQSAGRRHKCDFALESFMERFITSPIEPGPGLRCRVRCVSVPPPTCWASLVVGSKASGDNLGPTPVCRRQTALAEGFHLRPSFSSRLHLPHMQEPEPSHHIAGPVRSLRGRPDQTRWARTQNIPPAFPQLHIIRIDLPPSSIVAASPRPARPNHGW